MNENRSAIDDRRREYVHSRVIVILFNRWIGILKFIKNIGTFVGLSGIGVTLAGILLYLINKNEQPIKENYDI